MKPRARPAAFRQCGSFLRMPFRGGRWEWLPFQISTALFPPGTGQTARAGQIREGKRSPNFGVLVCFQYLWQGSPSAMCCHLATVTGGHTKGQERWGGEGRACGVKSF